MNKNGIFTLEHQIYASLLDDTCFLELDDIQIEYAVQVLTQILENCDSAVAINGDLYGAFLNKKLIFPIKKAIIALIHEIADKTHPSDFTEDRGWIIISPKINLESTVPTVKAINQETLIKGTEYVIALSDRLDNNSLGC